MNYQAAGDLQIAPVLKDFVDNEALPGTGLESSAFWSGLSRIVAEFAPRNAALLARRDELQAQIDGWHKQNRGKPVDQASYIQFLRDIGYLQPAPASKAP